MQFKKVFKGFYKSHGKRPVLKNGQINNNLVVYEEAKNNDSFVGYLAPGYILVDIDNKLPNGEYDSNKTESKTLIDILEQLEIDTPIIETDHGHHFFFSNSDKRIKSNVGVLCPIGLSLDYKLGDKNGASCLKLSGVERKIIKDTPNVAELPIFLKYNKILKNKLEEIKDGTADNGRNNFLSSYKYLLLKYGYAEKDVYLILETINDYILYEPLEHKELNTIMRQENIEANQEQTITDNFYAIDENGKLKLRTEKVAKFIVNEYSLIKIDTLLHKYNGKCYERITKKEIKDIIVHLIPSISSRLWNESAEKAESFAPKKEITKGYTTFKNGIINFKDRDFKLEEHNKNIITNFMVPTDYLTDIDTDEVEKYLKDLVCNDIVLYDNLIQSIGYLFYPNNFLQECLIIKGKNRNGKSTFLKFLVEMLGSENISNVGLKQFTSRFGAMGVVGKPFNIVDDISDEYIDCSEKFKQAVTGDPIEVEPKGEKAFRYTPIIKMLFTCNEIPKIKDPTGASKRRVRPLPFENIYSLENNNLDPFILEKLITEENKSAFLKLAIGGLETLLIFGSLPKSDKIELLREEFDEENNPIKLFIKETLGETDKEIYNALNHRDTKEIYINYDIWSGNNGYKSMSSNTFMRQLKSNVPKLIAKRYYVSAYERAYRYEFDK